MNILEAINNAKQEEMSDILLAVQRRYAELFPDWELHILTIEKTADKNEQLDKAIELLNRMKEM